jgi:predicted Zn-dependent protease
MNTSREMLKMLKKLVQAPAGEPYSGPVLFSGKAAAVLFHEIFGHRIEGHRQKDESSSQTFTGKLGKQVFPDIISIIDDPTLFETNGIYMNGYYPVDDEGVQPQRNILIKNGILKNFLMSRSGVKGCSRSSGHGRGEIGKPTISRMGNTIVSVKNSVSTMELRNILKSQCRKRGLAYGYFFDEITGGFTRLSRGNAQSFKVIPVVVYRVFTNEQPDELVNGVDIIGTPLAAVSSLHVGGDTVGVFNGYCGAESGYVPVSAVSPPLLFNEFEIERKRKVFETSPQLPFSYTGRSNIAQALAEQCSAVKNEVQIGDSGKAFYVAAYLQQLSTDEINAEYGSVISIGQGQRAGLSMNVLLGTPQLSSANFIGRDIRYRGGRGTIPFSADADISAKYAWRLADAAYKKAAETLTQKKEYIRQNSDLELFDDFTEDSLVSWEETNESEFRSLNNLYGEQISRLSDLARRYPSLEIVTLSMKKSRWDTLIVDTANSKLVFRPHSLMFLVTAEGRRSDGQVITFRQQRIIKQTSQNIYEQLKPELTNNLALLAELISADVMPDYTGPLIIQASAAATIFNQILTPLIQGSALPLSSKRGQGRNMYQVYKGRRILPSWCNVTDRPDLISWQGQPLASHMKYDLQGVKTKPVLLVTNGILSNALYTRRAGKFQNYSTGHSRNGGSIPMPSTLVFSASRGDEYQALKTSLLERCREEGLSFGLIITHVQHVRGNAAILAALKIQVDSGKEEIVYGGQLKNLSVRTLRDIIAVSKHSSVAEIFNWQQPARVVSIVMPDILIEEADISFRRGKRQAARLGSSPLQRSTED